VSLAVHAGERAPPRVDTDRAVRDAGHGALGEADEHGRIGRAGALAQNAELRTVEGERQRLDVLERVAAQEQLGEDDELRSALDASNARAG
jgi:hypothetical protein